MACYRFGWVMLVLLGRSMNGYAEEASVACPKSVAVIAGTYISSVSLEKIRPLYRQLGCKTQFIDYPGQRGIVEFNHGEVGGELIRLPIVESRYEKEFVRSSVPVLEVKKALWSHPDRLHSADQLIGYQLGVLWQKRYASQFDNSVRFYSNKEMYKAYEQGRVSSFLATYVIASDVTSRASFTVAPVIQKQLPGGPLYHYLAKEYAPLMQQLSRLLQSQR